LSAISPLPVDLAANDARRRVRLERWRQRSRLIHFLRRALPAAIIAILVVMAVWVLARGLLARIGDLRGRLGGAIHMTNAQFHGRDDQDRAYVVFAREASRDDFDQNRFFLVVPRMVFDSENVKESHISADRGVYRKDTRILSLRGHVSLRDSSGNNFDTEQAIVDTAHGTVAGQGRVTGTGPTGAITAQSFTVYDQGRRVVFRGNVHSVVKRG
jgi:lipopolysaccharide export system protein LptC